MLLCFAILDSFIVVSVGTVSVCEAHLFDKTHIPEIRYEGKALLEREPVGGRPIDKERFADQIIPGYGTFPISFVIAQAGGVPEARVETMWTVVTHDEKLIVATIFIFSQGDGIAFGSVGGGGIVVIGIVDIAIEGDVA